MQIIAFLLALMATPWRAVRRPETPVFGSTTKIVGYRRDGRPIPAIAGGALGHQSLFEDALVTLVHSPADSTPTSYTEVTYRVDMRDYDYVDFICIVGALNDAPTFKVQENAAASSGSASTDISGAVSTEVDDSTGDESVIILSVKKSSMTKRYAVVAVDFDTDGGSASIWGVVAVRYGKTGHTPVTQNAADTAGEGYKTIELIKA